MADSILALANRVLRRLGAQTITSLTASDDRAQIISGQIETTRRAALAMTRWNFAEGRCTLTGFPFIPPWGFDCAYYLPPDAVTIHETNLDEAEAYRIEMFVCSWNQTCNKVLVTDDACAPSVAYTYDNADITTWSPLFTYAYELQLTLDAADAFGRSAQALELKQTQVDRAWRKAMSKDGQEGKPKKSWLSNDLIRARLGGWGRRPDRLE